MGQHVTEYFGQWDGAGFDQGGRILFERVVWLRAAASWGPQRPRPGSRGVQTGVFVGIRGSPRPRLLKVFHMKNIQISLQTLFALIQAHQGALLSLTDLRELILGFLCQPDTFSWSSEIC